ncbi:DUF4236 domain-containing protein [Cloacibacillus porcorum]|uniref:DUF4236 domain-containing protein n=1 Tax=Cloacibacillus porcorum TaxID=1197717 RepID=UPI002672193E|nr:DUF4236 domain-containing protein [Cloacibacillus porcorum]
MGLRFRKSVKLCPGVRLNLSKSGVSTSFGVTGARVNVGKNGVYASAGIPGTGLYMREKISANKQRTLSTSHTNAEALAKVAEQGNAEIDSIINIHEVYPPRYSAPRYEREQFNVPKPVIKYSKKIIVYPAVAFVILFLLIGAAIGSLGGFGLGVIGAGIIYKVRKDNEISAFMDSHVIKEWEAKKADFERDQDQKEQAFYEKLATTPLEQEDKLANLFDQVDWPLETNISFEIDGSVVNLDVDLPEFEDMPKEIFKVRGRGQNKEVQEETKSERQQRLDYAKHVHGIIFFLARLIFNELPDLNEIIISGYTQRPAKDTGQIIDDYIISVRINRLTWQVIDLSNIKNIDPVECMEHFDLRRNMTKTGIFKTIETF